MNRVCLVSRQRVRKKIKKIRKTNKKSERREKIQNEHCLPGKQTTCSQKNLKNKRKRKKIQKTTK